MQTHTNRNTPVFFGISAITMAADPPLRHYTKDQCANMTVIDRSKILDETLREIESVYRVSRSVILGRRRSAHIAWARHVAIYLIATRVGLSSVMIGAMFNRDHGLVLHATKHVAEKLHIYPHDRKTVLEISTKLFGEE